VDAGEHPRLYNPHPRPSFLLFLSFAFGWSCGICLATPISTCKERRGHKHFEGDPLAFFAKQKFKGCIYPLDACVFSYAGVYVKISSVATEEIEDRFWEFAGVMASSGDGVGHLSSTSLVFGEGTSIPSRDGRDRKGLRTPQAVKEEITGNSRILAKPGWDSVTSLLWVCNTAKKYVKMHHIDKLFPEAVWKYNHRVSSVKPGESKSKHFAHRALEVWSALYPDKSFGLNNKNIISYSMAAIVYAEIELKRKVYWRTMFIRNKEDRTEYAKADVPDNFSFFRQNVGVGPALDARGANRNTSRSTRTIRVKDSVEKTIFFAKSGSRSKDEEGASASRKLDSTLPRLEGDIQDAGSVGGPNLNLIDLQRDLIILTSKYELLQHDACHSREGHQKLERERGVWILEKARMKEELKVLKSSEVQIQELYGDE
jgi:hypothetical protein